MSDALDVWERWLEQVSRLRRRILESDDIETLWQKLDDELTYARLREPAVEAQAE